MATLYGERGARSGSRCAENAPEDAWSGHLPITQRRLVSIMERAAAGSSDFTMAEQALFMLCEFWAAVVAGELDTHWRSGEGERVPTVITICAAIGLSEVADALTKARSDLAEPLTASQRRRRIAALEKQLLGLNTPIDQIIGGFAQAAMPVRNTCPSWEVSSALSGDAV